MPSNFREKFHRIIELFRLEKTFRIIESSCKPSTDKTPLNSTEGCLDCSDHTVVEFAVLRDMGQVKSEVRIPNFWKATFQLFKELDNRTPLGNCPQGQGRKTELVHL